MKKLFYFLILFGFISLRSNAQLKVTQLFSNNAVIQQGKPIKVWGTDSQGNIITCTIKDANNNIVSSGTSYVATNGTWFLEMPNNLVTGTTDTTIPEYSMTVTSGSGSLVFTGLVSGDVWIASGQSNMEYNFQGIMADHNGNLPSNMDEVKTDNLPYLRIFNVALNRSQTETRVLTTNSNTNLNRWNEMTDFSTIIQYQSAVGYYTGRTLHNQLKYPIGIIKSAVGGTWIEEWTPKEAIDTLGAITPTIALRNSTTDPQEALFNGMISPLIPLAMSGVIWYQGEANTIGTLQTDPDDYAEKTLACFNAWQNRWGQEFPVYTTMLAGWGDDTYVGTKTCNLRSEQLLASLCTNSIKLTSAYDLWDETNPSNIHPPHKKEVGERQAALILSDMFPSTYAKPTYPIVTGSIRNANEIRFTIQGVDQTSINPGLFKAYSSTGTERTLTTEAAFDPNTGEVVMSYPYQSGDFFAYNYNNYPIDNLSKQYNGTQLALGALPMLPYSSNFDYDTAHVKYKHVFKPTQYVFASTTDVNVPTPVLQIDSTITNGNLAKVTFTNVMPSKDTIYAISVPDNQVWEGKQVSVTVNYAATTSRILRVNLQLNQSPWTVSGSAELPVSAGVGSSVLTFTVGSTINSYLGTANHKISAFLTPDTSPATYWPPVNGTNYVKAKTGIDAIAAPTTIHPTSLSTVSQIFPGQVITVNVGYTATVSQDIIVNIVDNQDYSNKGYARVTVPAGITTKSLQVTVGAVGVYTARYTVSAVLVPVAGAWSAANGTAQQTLIDGIQAPPGDGITSIVAPTSVSPNQTVTVQVNYTALGTRDILLNLQKNAANWDNYGTATLKSVPATSNGTVSITFTVSSSIPIANNAYKIGVSLLPVDSTWAKRYNEVIQNNVSATSGGAIMQNNTSGALLSTQSINTGNDMILYPNPTNDKITLEFKDDNEKNIRIINMAGQLLYQKVANGSKAEINLKSLNVSGEVIIQVQSGKDVRTYKVIVR